MKQQSTQKKGVTPNVASIVEQFFAQLEPRKKKGRAWTFQRFGDACDMPNAERVQAVLHPDAYRGFTLYARQGSTVHAVTHEGSAVCFRTIETALTTLADVPHLAQEIIVNAADWREEHGPV